MTYEAMVEMGKVMGRRDHGLRRRTVRESGSSDMRVVFRFGEFAIKS